MSPIPARDKDANFKSHVLYKTGDSDAPGVVKDPNGEVVLDCCRRCGAGESQLYNQNCVERLLERSVALVKTWAPLERALHFAQQKRSWVIGEMMLANESVTLEQARAAYESSSEQGVLLAELERRMAGDAPAVGTRAAHYGAGRQPWDDILDAGWGPIFAAGNALKYVRRYKNKNGEDDLKKARWYYHELIARTANEDEVSRPWTRAFFDLEELLSTEEIAVLRQH